MFIFMTKSLAWGFAKSRHSVNAVERSINSSPKNRVGNIEANRSHGLEILKGLQGLQRSQGAEV